MTITTTNGERFTDTDQRALAQLMFKRFGRDPESFCAAWRRMLGNNAPDNDILKLALKNASEEVNRTELRREIVRDGYADAREVRVDLLDRNSCAILRRFLAKLRRDGERRGQRNIGRAIARGYVRP